MLFVLTCSIQNHVIDFTRLRDLNSLFLMIDQGIRNIQQYNQTHFDFPMQVRANRTMVFSIVIAWLWLVLYFLYLVAYSPSYREKTIKALLRARLGVAGHLSTTPKWGNSAECFSNGTSSKLAPACSSHCPFNAERQAGKL